MINTVSYHMNQFQMYMCYVGVYLHLSHLGGHLRGIWTKDGTDGTQAVRLRGKRAHVYCKPESFPDRCLGDKSQTTPRMSDARAPIPRSESMRAVMADEYAPLVL